MIPLYFIVHCIVYYVGLSVINISEDIGKNTSCNTNIHDTKARQRPVSK